MTAPHIIDPAGLLGEALSQASPDLMRSLLQHVINALLSADADAVCGAQWGQQDPQRHARRNGYRYRPLDTRVGTIDVAIPKLRSGTYFPEWLLQRRKRCESALITVVADCYLAGVSTRRMDRACQFFCVWGLEVGGDSVGVGGGELGEGLFPVGGGVSLDEAGVSCSFVGGFASICEALGGSFVFDVADGEPQEFDGGFFAGEMPAVLGDFA